MKVSNLGEIKAVVFDIDGTLYRAWKLNTRISFHFLRYNQVFLKYGIVRRIVRKIQYKSNFKDLQAELMAVRLKTTPDKANSLLDKVVYSGLAKHFKKIKPCPGAIELVKDLKSAGYKVGVLSDFPPEQKGDMWGIRDILDVCVGAEEAGALKPAKLPFETIVNQLNIPADEILYVGNSHKYDVLGSKSVGMKAAWFVTPLKGKFGKKSSAAEITFWKYSQLREILLGNINKDNIQN